AGLPKLFDEVLYPLLIPRVLQELRLEELLRVDADLLQQVMHDGKVAGAAQPLGEQVLGLATVADALWQQDVRGVGIRIAPGGLTGGGLDARQERQARQGWKQSASPHGRPR